MKLMLFIRALDVGGSQRQVALLARGLSKRGHDVAVVLLYSGGSFELTLKDSGVRILSLGKRGRWHVGGPLMRLWMALVRERPDVRLACHIEHVKIDVDPLTAQLHCRGLSFRLVAGSQDDADSTVSS